MSVVPVFYIYYMYSVPKGVFHRLFPLGRTEAECDMELTLKIQGRRCV